MKLRTDFNFRIFISSKTKQKSGNKFSSDFQFHMRFCFYLILWHPKNHKYVAKRQVKPRWSVSVLALFVIGLLGWRDLWKDRTDETVTDGGGGVKALIISSFKSVRHGMLNGRLLAGEMLPPLSSTTWMSPGARSRQQFSVATTQSEPASFHCV